MFVLLILSITIAYGFTPVEFNSSKIGYIINGIYCRRRIGENCVPSILVMDTPNNQFMIDITPFGKWIFTSTGMYIYNIDYPGCYTMASRNLMTKYIGHRTAMTDQSYFGLIDPADTCDYVGSFLVKLFLNIIEEVIWSLELPVPIDPYGGLGTRAYLLINDLLTIDRESNRSAYFVLPESCSTPRDYCELTSHQKLRVLLTSWSNINKY